MQLLSSLRSFFGKLLSGLRRFFGSEPPHVHDWFVCYSQGRGDGGVRVDVADCACGARAKIYPGVLPEIRIETPNPGGSAANVLIKDGESQLGDPQSERLQLLIQG